MKKVLYLTNGVFNTEEFAKLLNKIGVYAEVTKDGVILDKEGLNAIPVYNLPHWVYMNKKYINSPYHTKEV